MNKSTGILILLGLAGVAIVAVLFVEPIPQDPAYHDFADARSLLSIPNFADVFSNILFVIVGGLGIWHRDLLPEMEDIQRGQKNSIAGTAMTTINISSGNPMRQ